MTALYPLAFQPIFKERVWGGRTLETLYRKPLPPSVPIGDSWEISDRPGDESVVANGPLAGTSLRSLMESRGRDVLGDAAPAAGNRFPLLCKILDAREKLSLQVHPPAAAAAALGGEPKTEMWYVADAAPGAELYAGLKPGVTRAGFEAGIRTGRVAECVHRLPVRAGDVMFLPSGRVHAIGAGLVIFEIQQNSDTTYRVFDWNRVGLDGTPRELHVPQSLASIDFEDVEPELTRDADSAAGKPAVRALVRHGLFDVDLFSATSGESIVLGRSRLRIVAAIEQRIVATAAGVSLELLAGQFCVLPASLDAITLTPDAAARFLVVTAGCPAEG